MLLHAGGEVLAGWANEVHLLENHNTTLLKSLLLIHTSTLSELQIMPKKICFIISITNVLPFLRRQNSRADRSASYTGASWDVLNGHLYPMDI